ncbi:hypothetical protein REJC140_03849 [Pseudorhizobium endolithicum]|uniref:Uncharacterized protein n=2 Tax=Pseudorhizobium endolithicum TaxID=1191678 RepID=A0ABM8PRK2_9HYPH|nr:hypothetical protein REJC140_03849 [Pseudorhizobium endolithicum]
MNFFAKMPDWLRNGLLVIGGGLIGWFGNQYMDARGAYKESLTANYDSFNQASSGLEDSLREFAAIAQGLKPKTPEATVQLQSHLLDVLRVAKDLNRRLGHNEPVMTEFESATVSLMRAADRVTGPLDGKQMVEAVENYLFAEMQLRDAVVNETNAIVGGWLL